MSKTSKRKSEGRKSRSSSVGSREKRLSVFDRLGTKALPADSPPCRHSLYYASCPHCNLAKLSAHTLINSVTRATKKEGDFRQGGEEGVTDLDWCWDQSLLDCEDEKVLERKRQLLQRELELQMKSEFSKQSTSKKRSSSSSSSSSSGSSDASTSSTTSSESQVKELKKLLLASPEQRSALVKKNLLNAKMVYKDGGESRSPSRKRSETRKLPTPPRKMYKKKSPSPIPTSSRKSSPPLPKQKSTSYRRRESEVRGRSSSRERRRERSKESFRHRSSRPPASSRASHSSRGSDRKKEEDRMRREDSRRDRKYDMRDSKGMQEEYRIREKGRDKDSVGAESSRCRDRLRERRSGKESSRSRRMSSQRQRSYSRQKHYHQMSPSSSSHHHYRNERSRYGSSERERMSVYKELSPRQEQHRMRVSQSSSYSESSRMRRRGWESSRYDSPKSSSREWDPSSERCPDWDRVVMNDWQSRAPRDSLAQEERRSKHSEDKDFPHSEKEKEDWKMRSRDSDDASSVKRARIEEPPPICEDELSDISDDPDDILNRDDAEDTTLVEEAKTDRDNVDGLKEEESVHPPSTTSSNLDHRLLDQRMAEEEGMDSLDFEEISDEELEEESKNSKGDALGVDWGSLIAECRAKKKTEENKSVLKMWESEAILKRVGVSKQFAGDQLYDTIHQKLIQDGQEGLLSDMGGLERALTRKKHSNCFGIVSLNNRALSATSDLAIRRHLCGLAPFGFDFGPLSVYQLV